MNSGIDPATRLFTPFFDAVDMIASFPANTTLAEVNRAAGEHGLHFPLVLDAAASIEAHVAAAEFAPASARFGAYVDNLPGMNWRMPSGLEIRVGERVVKSTTGYDLFRFFLHAGERFGRATEYILRLRPVSGGTAAGVFTGPPGALDKVRTTLLTSSWNHWIDRIDGIVDATGTRIEAAADCQPGESSLFLDFFQRTARDAGAGFEADPAPPPPGLPAFTLKCTPGASLPLAAQCVQSLGGTARALLVNGVVLVHPEQQPPGAAFLAELRREVEPAGGHVFGTAVPPRDPGPAEAAWVEQLATEWSNL